MSRDAIKRNLSGRTGLARAISKLGYCSRAAARRLIEEGRVRVSGVVCRDPERPVRLGSERIEVDGLPIRNAKRIYLMMNKPRGIVTTASDEKGRETVYSLLPEGGRWLAPVGRLDKASEGLLLFTNDSEWAARIAYPESHVAKKYHVQIRTTAHEGLLKRLVGGVRESGELLKAGSAKLIRQGAKNCWIEIALDEGRNRQIRRMFAALDIEVLRLVRVAIGALELGDLPKGAIRELSTSERKSLVVVSKSF